MEWISRKTTSKTTTSCHGWTKKMSWPAVKKSWKPRKKRSSSPRKSLYQRRRQPKLPPSPRLSRRRRRLPRRRPKRPPKKPSLKQRQRPKPSPKQSRRRRPPKRKSAKTARGAVFVRTRKGLGFCPSPFFLRTKIVHSGTRSTGARSHLKIAPLSNRESRAFTRRELDEIYNCR